MFVAALLFSGGGFALLVGYLVFQGVRAGTHAFPAFAALSSFLAGWILLEEAVRTRAAIAVDEKPLRWGIWGALFLSLIVPLATLYFGGFSYFIFGVFPFIPIVYGPAVIAHAFLFTLAAKGQNGREAHYVLWAGSAVLAILAVVGLVSWLAFWVIQAQPVIIPFSYIDSPLLGLAGYTGVGYVLIAVGWWRLLRKVESQPG